jgi:hypothetical protein
MMKGDGWVILLLAGVLALALGGVFVSDLYSTKLRFQCFEQNGHRPAVDVLMICRGVK